ncbi:TetR/AcrR family transcriptional regulator C-terminal domain-containing protein [Streptomyces sp. NBC_01142]|uniref:TetR/AcrR family transcriptional regulator C-terminal domain-containing protein n=1 Tax=Streptomyces sp. NBC_01142 TaxID=2975865 RepID=UPI00224DF1C4|nr:TetR/AcrR family transcriptional regulator C-terminal domain-containing protein [Streptomyces sp. NBC_01142]MCX4819501.1 TetR/AcrR family transcriptional regulator C-terminal domain-containing protein [Streptomyces sp. NBC_01142]
MGPVPADWRTGVEIGARWPGAVYARHPWTADPAASLTRPAASASAMNLAERVLRALRMRSAHSLQKMFHTLLTLFAYVQGPAIASEWETRTEQDTGIADNEWAARNETPYVAISVAVNPLLLNSP